MNARRDNRRRRRRRHRPYLQHRNPARVTAGRRDKVLATAVAVRSCRASLCAAANPDVDPDAAPLFGGYVSSSFHHVGAGERACALRGRERLTGQGSILKEDPTNTDAFRMKIRV